MPKAVFLIYYILGVSGQMNLNSGKKKYPASHKTILLLIFLPSIGSKDPGG